MIASSPISQDEYRTLLAARMSERDLQARVLVAARVLGYLVYHTHDSRRSQPGYPDLHLVCAKRGRSLFRELKTTRGKVSPNQQAWIVELRAVGIDVGVWRPMDLLDGTVGRELGGSE